MAAAGLSNPTTTYFAEGSTTIAHSVQDRGILCATAELAAPVQICVAHLSKPVDGSGRVAAKEAQKFTKARRSSIAKIPTVVAGDFNAEPFEIRRYAKAFNPAKSGAHDAYPVNAGVCQRIWEKIKPHPCSDHRIYFGTLHYHE